VRRRSVLTDVVGYLALRILSAAILASLVDRDNKTYACFGS